MANVSKEEFLACIKQRLGANFELEDDGVEGTLHCNLIARYRNVSGRILITPQDIIDRMETFERVYVKYFDVVDVLMVQQYFDELCRLVRELSPEKDHFQTDITGVIVCDHIPDQVGRQVKKLRFDKIYGFYFRGWCEVRMVCVNLSTAAVYTNPAGKELKNVYAVKK